MCGIGGCVASAGVPDRGALAQMAAALGHRGPDDSGIEVIGPVGLVHTRLSIVDPSPAGHEPMRHQGGRWWLTYNGEVFNHAELREQLPPVTYRGHSDTETLLHALASWGESAIPRCNGLFAFAALDLERRRLLLVRDRFGVKPLYFAPRPEALWFASEIGALLAAGLPRRPRRDVLLHALRHGWANGRPTPVDGIYRVGPGTVVSVDIDTLERSEARWYEPADQVDPERAAELSSLDRAQLADAVGAALSESVRRRLMADVPVGTMCSGGVDSSLATAFAAEHHPRILAFNASVADQPDADEAHWARLVADALGIELLTVRMTEATWRADLVDVVRHVEYPLNHESSVPMWQIADLARSRGVKVLLSGEGADELFGGYEWVAPWLARDFTDGRPLPERLARAPFRWLRGVRIGRAIRRLPGTDCAEVAAFEREVDARALAAYRHHRGPRRRLEAQLLELLGTYLPHLLNRQDKATMKGSIETREPYLDPELVALALNLPLEARTEPDRKGVLREIARRRLPPGVAERKKVGFGFDVGRYLRPAARPEFLLDGALRELHGVARGPWRRMVSSAAWALPVWTAEIWYRALIEAQPTDRIEAELWRDLEPAAAPSSGAPALESSR